MRASVTEPALTEPADAAGARSSPPFGEALRFWIRLGFVSFGGPAGQIAILHREAVERRGWISEGAFSRGLAFCTSLPGPEAQQLATWIGWRLHGLKGALAAGAAFVLPAVALLLGLSWIRAEFGALPAVGAFLWGLRVAVVAVIFDAAFGMAVRRLTGTGERLLAVAALAASVARAPFPAIVAGAALLGLALRREEAIEGRLSTETGGVRRFAATLATGLGLWAIPWIALLVLDAPSVLAEAYSFFTKAAFVTFGGAYAVLSYVLDAATGTLAWLSRAEAVDGVALAETTPGPLIIVLQYVGFFAGWNAPGEWPRAATAAGAALLTSWATFLPSTGLVILLAPWVERITSAPRLQGVFRGVGAAVVGVVFAFALGYASEVFRPGGSGRPVDVLASTLTIVAFLIMRLRGVGLVPIVGAGAALGITRAFLEVAR